MNAQQTATAAQAIAAARNASAEATAAQEYMEPALAAAVITLTNISVESIEAATRAAGIDPATLVYWASGSHEWRAYNDAP